MVRSLDESNSEFGRPVMDEKTSEPREERQGHFKQNKSFGQRWHSMCQLVEQMKDPESLPKPSCVCKARLL